MLGVVASGHADAADAAAGILRAGGNAFDAAIAAGFAATVVEPMFTSLGGGGFLLARTAEGRETLFDFFADTPGRGLPDEQLEPHFFPAVVHFPASDQTFNIGLGSVAVPGALAGFLEVHRRLGRVALQQIVAPAVQLARDGVVLNEAQAYALDLLTPINTLTADSRALFAPAGRTPRAGERFFNPELAGFLEVLPDDGGHSLYGGSLARRIAEDMRKGGGLLTEEDLAAYRVAQREPLAIAYRGRRVLTNPPPSMGGSLLGFSLRVLDRALPETPVWGSPAHLRGLAAAMVEVEALRARGVELAGSPDPDRVADCATRVRRASGGTTHVSVADAAGNAASMTLSNGEGSGYIAPGTGIMLNNMLGEDDLHPEGFHASPAGLRVSSMMSPSLVLRGKKVELIVGSGGSKRIRTAMMQVIDAVIGHGMDVEAAVEAPRLHWDGESIQAEPGFAQESLADLERTWRVNRWGERNLYFGGVQAVDPSGAGAGDPRRGGQARLVTRDGDPAPR
jgi:gamma-glutamyltranspeptidase/glutathione hydrolase